MAKIIFGVKFQGLIKPMAGTSQRPSFPKALTLTSLFRSYGLGEQWSRAWGKLRYLPPEGSQKKLHPKTFLRSICVQHQRVSSSFCYPRWYCKLPPNWRTLLRWFDDDRNTTSKFAGEGICRGIIDNCDTLVQTFWPRKIHQSKISPIAMQEITVLFWIGWKGSLEILNLDFLLLTSSEASGLKSTNPANVVEWQDFLLSPGGLLLRPNWHTWFVSSDLAMNSWNGSFLRGFSKTES